MQAASRRRPLNLSGELYTGQRFVKPDDREGTLQSTYTAAMDGGGYVWRPWLATWDAGMDISHITTKNLETKGTQEVDLFGGRGNLRLIPQSRFPFSAFFSIRDTRTERESLDPLQDLGDRRYTRFGANQHFRSRSGRTSFLAQAERNIEDDLNGDRDTLRDHYHLRLNHRKNNNRFWGTFNLRDEYRAEEDREELDWIFDANHTYDPNTRLSVENRLNIRGLDASDSGANSEEMQGIFSNSTVWRDPNRPLVLRGNFDLEANSRKNTGDPEAREERKGRVAVGARYNITDALLFTGDAGLEKKWTVTPRNFQTAALSYAPPSIPLGKTNYNWNVRGGARHERGEDSEHFYGATVGAGHSLNQRIALRKRPALALVYDLGQDINIISRIQDTTRGTLHHRGSVALTRDATKSDSSLRLMGFDLRSFGDDARANTQTLTFSGTFRRTLSRYSSWMAMASMSSTRSESDERVVEEDQSFRAELSYNHANSFGLRGLRFRSKLELDSSEHLIPLSLASRSGDRLRWENRFDYPIGKLYLRFNADLIRSAGNNQQIYFLSIRRRF